MKKYICGICGYIYEEAKGIPEAGINPGTKWEQLPDGWVCPICKASKLEFEELKPINNELNLNSTSNESTVEADEDFEDLREMSFAEMSALCSSLAKGCEKQYLDEEAKQFNVLAKYYNAKINNVKETDYSNIIKVIENDLENRYTKAKNNAQENSDPGAMRALVWSEKVSKMQKSLVSRYQKIGDKLLDNTNVYVCEICGFIYIGDNPPAICPVCKVPNNKLTQIRRK